MLYGYGKYMPLRAMEEIYVWKTREREHAAVILGLVPRLEESFAQPLRECDVVLAATQLEARQHMEMYQRSRRPQWIHIRSRSIQLTTQAIQESGAFISQLLGMVDQSEALKETPGVKVFISHAVRESQYFSGKLHAYTLSQEVQTTPS